MNNEKETITVNLDGKPQIAFFRGKGVFESAGGQEFRLPDKEEDILKVFRNRERRIARLNAAAIELTGNNIPTELQNYQESPEDGLISEYMLPDYTKEIDELLAEFSRQGEQKDAFEEDDTATTDNPTTEEILSETISYQNDESKENKNPEFEEIVAHSEVEAEKVSDKTKTKVQQEVETKAESQKEDRKKIAKAEKKLSKELKKAEKKKSKEKRHHKGKSEKALDISDVLDVSEESSVSETPSKSKKKPPRNNIGTVLIIVLLVLALIFVMGLFIGQSATIGWFNPQPNLPNSISSTSAAVDSSASTPEQIIPHISLTIDAAPDAEVSGEIGAKPDSNNTQETNESQSSEQEQEYKEGDNS